MLERINIQIGRFVTNLNEKRKETHYSKSGLSNLLVNRMQLIVALRICVFILLLEDEFRKKSVFVRSRKETRDICGLTPLKPPMRMHPPSTHEVHWSRKIQAESGNHPHTHNILTAAKATRRWPNEFQDTRAEQGTTLSIPKAMIETTPLNSSTPEKRISVKAMASSKKRNFARTSRNA